MEEIRTSYRKAYEYVFDYISEQILLGTLKLNDRIPTERELSENLGISRNSIREVLHMLEITGLIECVQGSGNYVRCDPKEYMLKSVNMVMSLLKINYTEIFHIRMGYELTALKLAIEVATDEEIEEMRQTLLMMEEPMSAKESAKYDVQFHSQLLKSSHNRLLKLYSDMLSDLMDQFIVDFRERILMNKQRADALKKSHWEIYHGLKDRDYAKGRTAMEKHFEVVYEQVSKIERMMAYEG